MNRSTILSFFIASIYCLPVQAQQDFSSIDHYVDSISHFEYPTLQSLIKVLAKPEYSDLEKTRSTFYWVAKNIHYDWKSISTGYWNTENFPTSQHLLLATFQQKKGVCSGYAYLLKAMLDSCGIENEVVEGTVLEANRDEPAKDEDHIWNAVRIDGSWTLLDATWASPQDLKGKVDDTYFLADPRALIASHYPTDYRWSLLDEQIQPEERPFLPVLSKDFFRLGFGSTPLIVKREGNTIRFPLPDLEGVIIGFQLHQLGTYNIDQIDFKWVRMDDEKSGVEIVFPDDEPYELEMTAIHGTPLKKIFGLLFWRN